MRPAAIRHSPRVSTPAATGPRAARAARRPARRSNMVLPRDLGELYRIAEQAIERPVDGAGTFQDAERDIDLGTGGAEELRQLALGKSEIERHALSRRR